jgi:hypothetical protein
MAPSGRTSVGNLRKASVAGPPSPPNPPSPVPAMVLILPFGTDATDAVVVAVGDQQLAVVTATATCVGWFRRMWQGHRRPDPGEPRAEVAALWSRCEARRPITMTPWRWRGGTCG